MLRRVESTDDGKTKARKMSKNAAGTTTQSWNKPKDTKADRTFLIKEGWKEVYLMCAYGVPPDSWKEDLTEEL